MLEQEETDNTVPPDSDPLLSIQSSRAKLGALVLYRNTHVPKSRMNAHTQAAGATRKRAWGAARPRRRRQPAKPHVTV